MSATAPRFSVIVPTHLRAMLLERAIVSIKSQADSHLVEIVVVSDVVDAATEAVCHRLLGNSDVFVRRNGAPGPSRSRNVGLSLASGKHILFLDDDDSWHAGFLHQLAKALDACRDGFVYVDCSVVKERRPSTGPEFVAEHPLDLSASLNELVYVKNQVHMSCFAFPRSLLMGLQFDEHMRAYEDWEFLLAVFDRCMPKHVPIRGSRVFEVDDETTDRRGSGEAAQSVHAVLDYLYVYRRHAAPSPLLQQRRAELMAAVGLNLPREYL